MSRLYIAGPMTGILEHNFPAFHAAAAAWRDMGWEVMNPAESFDGRTDLPYREYVKHDMEVLRTCDAIAMLPEWDAPTSRGAVWELEVAAMLGLKTLRADRPFACPPKVPATVLDEAKVLVHGDRGTTYGHPIEDYTRTGKIWGAILGTDAIDPRICCLMMCAVKMSREVNKHKRDNLVDLAGYAECANMVADRQAEG